MLNTKEKGLAPSAGPPQKKLNIFSSESITDRLEFVNILFEDLSGYIEIREIKNGQANTKYLKNTAELMEYDPPVDNNIYIGMFTRKQKRGRNKDIQKTQVLWLDFDDVESFI